MIKANRLNKGDKVAIVSLSSGMLGEDFAKHNIEIGTRRLKAFGLEPVFMANALKGLEYVSAHPEKRAEDLIKAFRDDSIKGIICAIGGNDTYRTLSYLMENQEFLDLVKNKPKLFTGFSDTTVNHLMFYKLGLTTYYGMTFVTDIAEISEEMLPYTEEYFNYYFSESANYEKITPSNIWYEERTDFSKNAIGKDRISHVDDKGFELLHGSDIFEGELLGGCLESFYDMLTPFTHSEKPSIIKKFNIFPPEEIWEDKILFLETSEMKISPKEFKKIINELKDRNIFDKINGLIVGKPQDEAFYEEYKVILNQVINNSNLPVVYNVNFGHATPRCVIPYGIKARVDVKNQEIKFLENPFNN